jgi:pilus assembly protein Flp/PilA
MHLDCRPYALHFRSFAEDEEGATAIEYGLIAALMAIALISGLLVMRDAMNSMYTSITSEVTDTMN